MLKNFVDLQSISPELCEIIKIVERLPTQYRESFVPVLERAVRVTKSRNKIQKLIASAIQDLNHEIAHLKFDLEITRAERDELKKSEN